MNFISTQKENYLSKGFNSEPLQKNKGGRDHRKANNNSIAHISTHSLTLLYGEKPAFQDISLSINRQSITALVGPSGCGKSSFLNCLNRLTDLIPKCRVTGHITLDAEDIHAPSIDVISLRRRVGMIFQKPTPFPISIRKNIILPLAEHHIRQKSDQDRLVETVLNDVGLWDEVKDRLNAPALSLSGGQQQRLCIARALALKPEVILFDEPCSALDPIASGIVEDLIASLGMTYTVVIVTHNLPQAQRISNYTAFFWMLENTGRLVECGPTQHLFENPKDDLTKAYFNGVKG